MGKLDGKVAIITGGASGIGEGTVKLFVENGARVAIADIQDEKGHVLATALGEDTFYQRTDVSSEDDVRGVVEKAVARFGRLDCIFNNAGFGGVTGPLEETTLDEWDHTMNVLLRGPFLGIKYAAPAMKATGGGSIVSTASVAGLRSGLGPHIYSVAKSGVIALTKTAALEMAPAGIRVNCICPGAIATPLVMGERPMDEVEKTFSYFQPLRRSGMPVDIANAAMWLASDDASFITGHAMVVDGGLTAGTMWSQQPDIFRTHTPMMLRNDAK